MDGIDPNAPSYLAELTPSVKLNALPQELVVDYSQAVTASADVHAAMAVYQRKYEGDNAKQVSTGQSEQRPRVNLVASTIEQMVAMNSWKNPRITALPVETGDVLQSHAVNALFRFWQHHLKLRDLQERLNRTGFLFGTAIPKVLWIKDENAYERGKFRVVSCNPMNFHPDPHATCLEDMRYCTFDTVWSLAAAKQQWPDMVPQPSNSVGYEPAVHSPVPPQSVVVHETYYAPTRTKPDGRVIFWTSFGILEEKKIETPDHRYPFSIFYNVPSTTSFWGISEAHNMIPIQAAYNNVLWWIMQALRYSAVGKYVTNDIGFKGKTINMNLSEVLVLEGGDKAFLKALDRPSVDTNNLAMLGMLFGNIQQVSGVHSVQEGNPGSVTAATALQTLAMLGSQRMDTRKLHMADTMGDVAEILIEMAGKGGLYTKNHFVRVLGTDAPIVISPEDIRADLDIMCSYQESFPEELNARLQMMAQMAAMKPEQRALIARWTGDPLLIETAMEFSKGLEEGAAELSQPSVGGEGLPAPVQSAAPQPPTAQEGSPVTTTQQLSA
jgi:hypothetical protein